MKKFIIYKSIDTDHAYATDTTKTPSNETMASMQQHHGRIPAETATNNKPIDSTNYTNKRPKLIQVVEPFAGTRPESSSDASNESFHFQHQMNQTKRTKRKFANSPAAQPSGFPVVSSPNKMIYRNTHIVFRPKKRIDFSMQLEPQSDFEVSDDELDATDVPMIRFRLVCKIVEKSDVIKDVIESLAMQQNQQIERAVAGAVAPNPHFGRAEYCARRKESESEDAFEKRIEKNALLRSHRLQSKMIRVSTAVRWQTVLHLNKGMRAEMRTLRREMVRKLERLGKSKKKHALSECFTEDARIDFLYEHLFRFHLLLSD